MDEASWLVATPLLARAQAALAPGQMVHDDSFSLFESMSAIEIGAALRCCCAAVIAGPRCYVGQLLAVVVKRPSVRALLYDCFHAKSIAGLRL